MDIEEALERWRNSDGFACSDKTDDGVMECLVTLAQWADSLDASIKQDSRILRERIAELEHGLTVLHLQFGEPYYSWQRVLYRVQQLIRRRNECAEACLNAIGVLRGHSVLTTEQLIQRCVDAVRPIVSGEEEPPEFERGSERGIERRDPMRLIRDNAHWYIIPESREDEFYEWCQSQAQCTKPPSDWEPERINGVRSIRILAYENLDL